MTLLHAYEWGDTDAPAVVCLHGINAHGLRFRKLAEERLAARFRVVALDLRGHGHSEHEPPWDLETHLEDLAETAATLGIDQADWIGHSYGARLAMELTARRPELVTRLVLLEPAVWVPPPIALDNAERERGDRSFETVDEAIDRRRVTSGLRSTPRELLVEDCEQHLVRSDDGRLRYRYSQASVVAAFGEMSKPPPPFEAVRVPTLLVRGAETDVVPPAIVEAYSHGIGGLLEVATVRGGHNVLWDAFPQTADAVERFLADGPAPR